MVKLIHTIFFISHYFQSAEIDSINQVTQSTLNVKSMRFKGDFKRNFFVLSQGMLSSCFNNQHQELTKSVQKPCKYIYNIPKITSK